MHSLLSLLFIVLINETDGNDKETGIETSVKNIRNI